MARNASRNRSAEADQQDDESRRSNDRDPQDEDQGQDPANAAVEAANRNAPAAAAQPAPRVQVAEARNPAEADERAPNLYALCPGQVNPNAPLDFRKATDVKIYNSATEPFNKDKPYDVESPGLMQFMMEVHNRANEHGWTDPNHGLCMITVTENGVTEKYDLTSQYGCVSIDQVIASDTLALQYGTRKAQNSMMLHKLLMGCLSSIGKNKVMTPEYQRKIKVNGQQSGNVLLKIITEIARPQTPASVQMLRNNITNMCSKMAEFGQDIAKFNAYVIEQIQGLAAFGQTYDNIEYHLLQAYDQCTDQVFHAYLTKIKDEHETGERSYSYDQIMKYAVNKFHLMVQKNEWNPGKGSVDDRLLALETRTNGRIPSKDRSKNKQQQGGKPGGIKEIDPSRNAPKGGNWTSIPPKGGPSVKAKITRKTRNGEKTFYWCSVKNGGQCDPGFWRAHKPEDCKWKAIKAEREKKNKSKDEKKESLKVEATIIHEPPEEAKAAEEKEPEKEPKWKPNYDSNNEFWRDTDDYYYDSERSLSSEQGMEGDPHFFTNKAKRRDAQDKKHAKRRAKIERQRANKQKKLLVEEAKITGEDDPEAKKPRTDGN